MILKINKAKSFKELENNHLSGVHNSTNQQI